MKGREAHELASWIAAPARRVWGEVLSVIGKFQNLTL